LYILLYCAVMHQTDIVHHENRYGFYAVDVPDYKDHHQDRVLRVTITK